MSDKISLSQPQPEVVPSEAVAIPSEGKFYPEDFPLCDKQFVEIRPMTARDEDILTSRALFKTGKVIDSLLRSCVIQKGIDTTKMLVGDRNAAIIGIRVSGYGAQYTAKMECPSCEAKSDVDVDLGSLPLKNVPADVQPISAHTNEFSYKLAVSKKTANFRLPTGADEQELSVLIDRMRKTTGGESLVTSRLMQQIVSIDGETDKSKLSNMIRALPAKDSRELRSYMDYAAPDVKLVQNYSCSVCGFEAEEVEVPLGTEFFWPKSER
jgi:rubredoxin